MMCGGNARTVGRYRARGGGIPKLIPTGSLNSYFQPFYRVINSAASIVLHCSKLARKMEETFIYLASVSLGSIKDNAGVRTSVSLFDVFTFQKQKKIR